MISRKIKLACKLVKEEEVVFIFEDDKQDIIRIRLSPQYEDVFQNNEEYVLELKKSN